VHRVVKRKKESKKMSYASEKKRGVVMNAGRAGKGTRQVKGDNTIVTQVGSAHGNEGRDERSAARAAEYGNQITKNPGARTKSYE
jgi:hypothetical protein